MDFLLLALDYSANGELPVEKEPYDSPLGNRSYFSDIDVSETETPDDAWELVETGLRIWNQMLQGHQRLCPLQQAVSASTHHNVLVAFDKNLPRVRYDKNLPYPRPTMPRKLHRVSYMDHTAHDPRFKNVDDHREWFKVAYRLTELYMTDVARRVKAARNLYNVLLLAQCDESVEATQQVLSSIAREVSRTKHNSLLGSGNNEIESDIRTLAFEKVHKYFLSTPQDVLQTIADNRGSIKLRRMNIYEAACILDALRVHFKLGSVTSFGIDIEIEKHEKFRWFGVDRKLHNSKKDAKQRHLDNSDGKLARNKRASKGSGSNWVEFSDLESQFLKDLQEYRPSLPPHSDSTKNSPTTPQ